MWKLATILAIGVTLCFNTFGQQQFSPTQLALLNQIYAEAGEDTIPGTWLQDGSIPLDKLEVLPLTAESDPLFVVSVAASILASDLSRWNAAYTYSVANGYSISDLQADVAQLQVDLDAAEIDIGIVQVEATNNAVDIGIVQAEATNNAVNIGITQVETTNNFDWITTLNTNLLYHDLNTPQWLTNTIAYTDADGSTPRTNEIVYWGVP